MFTIKTELFQMPCMLLQNENDSSDKTERFRKMGDLYGLQRYQFQDLKSRRSMKFHPAANKMSIFENERPSFATKTIHITNIHFLQKVKSSFQDAIANRETSDIFESIYLFSKKDKALETQPSVMCLNFMSRQIDHIHLSLRRKLPISEIISEDCFFRRDIGQKSFEVKVHGCRTR